MSSRLDCPACDEQGEHVEEDQARCLTPACRVTTFQTTTPPDAWRPRSSTDADRAAALEERRRLNKGVETRRDR